MQKWIVCAATPSSGVSHRLMMLSAVKHFAESHAYGVHMWWGVTGGVSDCRFEELFAPIPGVVVANLSRVQMAQVVDSVRSRRTLRATGTNSLRIFRPGELLPSNFFCWDLAGAWALAKLATGRPSLIVVKPSPAIRAEADAYARAHRLSKRLGIRVRVEELRYRPRKPHRIQKELDEVVRSIVRIPWYTKVFVVTDSEYVQQMLASHFSDTVFLHKNFDLEDVTGRYVHRQDKTAMFTFLKEVDCLCRCDKVINIGGFLNDHSIASRILREPYSEAAQMHLVRR